MPERTSISKALAVLWPYIVAVVTVTAYISFHFGNERFDDEKNRLVRQVDTLTAKNKALDSRLTLINDSLKIVNQTVDTNLLVVMSDGHLTPGFDMGIATSQGDTGWVKKIGDAQVVSYASGRTWGTMFVTVGKPVKIKRPFKDFSKYSTLDIELNGTIGERVLIGLKTNTDPDDGSEVKYPIAILRDGWNSYRISLTRFTSANLHRLYVVTEFVFDERPQNFSVRKIAFERQGN